MGYRGEGRVDEGGGRQINCKQQLWVSLSADAQPPAAYKINLCCSLEEDKDNKD